MQYEFPHFRIDRSDWLKGSNTYENYPDGGIIFSSSGYNVFKKPGWLANSPDLGNTVTSSLPTNIGISWGYGKGAIAQQVMVVGSNGSQDGSFYTVDTSGAFTKVGSDDTGRDYQLGKTSTVFYHGSFYTTSTTDICKNSSDLATRDTSWWVTTKGQTSLNSFAPHPQVVFGDIHYIADGQYIHQDDNGTVQYNVFDLGQDWVITSMEVYNNKIYIAAEPYFNFSGTSEGFSRLFTWNGYSDSWIDEWFIGPRINALKVFKNVLYCWTPAYMGYWNGSAIKNLYPLNSSGSFPYTDGIVTTEDSMYFPDHLSLIRYGSPTPSGKNRFHRFQTIPTRANSVGSYTRDGIEVCATGVSNGSNHAFNSFGTPGGNKSYQFNRRLLSRPIRVRAYVIHTNGMASGQYAEFSYIDHAGTSSAVRRFGYAASALMQGKQVWRFDILGQPPTTLFDPVLTLAGDVYVRAIDVLYEPSNDKLNA